MHAGSKKELELEGDPSLRLTIMDEGTVCPSQQFKQLDSNNPPPV